MGEKLRLQRGVLSMIRSARQALSDFLVRDLACVTVSVLSLL